MIRQKTNLPHRRTPTNKCKNNDKNKKLPYKHHNNNYCKQNLLMNAETIREKQDAGKVLSFPSQNIYQPLW